MLGDDIVKIMSERQENSGFVEDSVVDLQRVPFEIVPAQLDIDEDVNGLLRLQAQQNVRDQQVLYALDHQDFLDSTK